MLSLQSPEGEIYWALDTRTGINKDALVTGCSSIYKSLECMANIQATLGQDPQRWLTARHDLGEAVRHKPQRFDRTWESKARYSHGIGSTRCWPGSCGANKRANT